MAKERKNVGIQRRGLQSRVLLQPGRVVIVVILPFRTSLIELRITQIDLILLLQELNTKTLGDMPRLPMVSRRSVQIEMKNLRCGNASTMHLDCLMGKQ